MAQTEQARVDRRSFLRVAGLGAGAIATAGALDLAVAPSASAATGPAAYLGTDPATCTARGGSGAGGPDGDLAKTTDYRAILAEILEKRCEAGSVADVFPGLSSDRPGVVDQRPA